MTPRPGEQVLCRYTKWGGARHHGGMVTYLGEDEAGRWFADPAGNRWSGGPKEFVAVGDNMFLVPRDRWFTAFFYEPHPTLSFAVYADITTLAQVTPGSVTAVDLDLDVIRAQDGSVYIDDEDEFAEHQVSYGYPAEVIAAAEAECRRVRDELRGGAAHFDPALAERWRQWYRSRAWE